MLIGESFVIFNHVAQIHRHVFFFPLFSNHLYYSPPDSMGSGVLIDWL